MKKPWIDYYLINMSGKINKLFTNSWFGKTIIKKNKDKVKLLANTISNKFLREIVILNIISFAKNKKVMAKESGATNHYYYHSIIKNTIDLLKLF